MTFKVVQLAVGQMANYSYILADEETEEAAVIDPSWELDRVFDTLKRNGWNAKYIINTHSHFDHVLGNEQAAEVTGAKIIQHENSKLNKDLTVRAGSFIDIGKTRLKVLHTPGHSEDSMCLVVEGHLVFTGDTLFVGTCGRVDLPGSDPAKMYHSLFDILSKLDEQLIVYPGHNYGPTESSTIGREKSTNYVLRPMSEQEFLEFMGAAN